MAKKEKSKKKAGVTVGTKRQVYQGTRSRTVGGLTRRNLMKNKLGHVVSKKKHKLGEKNNWAKCVVKARKELKFEGFIVLNKGAKGKALLKRAQELAKKMKTPTEKKPKARMTFAVKKTGTKKKAGKKKANKKNLLHLTSKKKANKKNLLHLTSKKKIGKKKANKKNLLHLTSKKKTGKKNANKKNLLHLTSKKKADKKKASKKRVTKVNKVQPKKAIKKVKEALPKVVQKPTTATTGDRRVSMTVKAVVKKSGDVDQPTNSPLLDRACQTSEQVEAANEAPAVDTEKKQCPKCIIQ